MVEIFTTKQSEYIYNYFIGHDIAVLRSLHTMDVMYFEGDMWKYSEGLRGESLQLSGLVEEDVPRLIWLCGLRVCQSKKLLNCVGLYLL